MAERILATGADAAGTFAVFGVEPVEDLHALDDPSEGHERLAIVRGRVVPEVDEDLSVRHARAMAGSPLTPNCTHRPTVTRKKRASS